MRRTFRTRRGDRYSNEVVLHPGAAVVLPILADGRIVMIRNRRIAVGRTLLELPAGTLDPGESPLRCARRELEEETGYAAARMKRMVSFFSSPGISSEMMHVFLATGLRPGRARPEATEELSVVQKTRTQALAAVRAGRIRDAKSMIGLLFYERFASRP